MFDVNDLEDKMCPAHRHANPSGRKALLMSSTELRGSFSIPSNSSAKLLKFGWQNSTSHSLIFLANSLEVVAF
jgi:hypothetical protein